MGSVIFGAGAWGKQFKRWLENYLGVNICAIVTTREYKWGKKIDNVEIISPKNLLT